MTSLVNNNLSPIPVFSNEILCDEKPNQIAFIMSFLGVDEYTCSLKNLVDAKKVTAVRSVFFDNARNNSDVVMQITNTQQTVLFPRRKQGYIPVLMNPEIDFALTTVAGTGVFKITLLNFIIQPFMWDATL